MCKKIRCKHISNTIYVLIYLCLCALSIFLVWGVLMKYASNNSSFKTVSLPITMYPVITICFPDIANLTYGKEFTILKYKKFEEYLADKSLHNNELVEGENFKVETHLLTVQTAYMGNCFQLTSLAHEIETRLNQFIVIKFLQEKYATIADLYFTSKSNANGALMSWWMDGDNFVIRLNKNTRLTYGISQKLYDYLSFKNKCTPGEKSFYDCFRKTINSSIFSNCSTKCLPFELTLNSNESLAMCKTNSEEHHCAKVTLWEHFQDVEELGICKRPCTINEYRGYKIYDSSSTPTTSVLSYYFLVPRNVTGRIEYLIFDTIGMITAFGGTLGLCIGFSLKGSDISRFVH